MEIVTWTPSHHNIEFTHTNVRPPQIPRERVAYVHYWYLVRNLRAHATLAATHPTHHHPIVRRSHVQCLLRTPPEDPLNGWNFRIAAQSQLAKRSCLRRAGREGELRVDPMDQRSLSVGACHGPMAVTPCSFEILGHQTLVAGGVTVSSSKRSGVVVKYKGS